MTRIKKKAHFKISQDKRTYFPPAKKIKDALLVRKSIAFILDGWRFFQVSETNDLLCK